MAVFIPCEAGASHYQMAAVFGWLKYLRTDRRMVTA